MGKQKQVKNKPKKNVLKQNKKLNHEILGLIICAVGLILTIGIYSEGNAILLRVVREFLGGIFGTIIYAIPPIIVIYGLFVMFEKADLSVKKKILLLMVLFVLIAGLVHTYSYGEFTNIPTKFNVAEQQQEGVDYDRLTKELYDKGSQKKGGGLFGGLISFWLVSLVGVYASFVIFSAAAIIIILLLTQISFVNIVLRLKEVFLWMFKVTIKSITYIKQKMKIKSKKKKKSKSKDLKFYGKIMNMTKKKRNNKENKKEVEQVKNETPERIETVVNEQYEQQEINQIKTISEQKDTLEQEAASQESVQIDASTDEELVKNYKIPPLDLLKKPSGRQKTKDTKKEMTDSAKKLEETLNSFGVQAKVVEINRGPTVTRYEIQPSVGVKVSKIVNLADDIALNLAASGIRIEAPIPGKAAVGIEVPNRSVDSVPLREIIETNEFKKFNSRIPLVLGKDISGNPVITDIAKMPHLLIAGSTGSGKSVCINTLIASILYKSRPDEVKLLMIDPKVVELGVYSEIPHLLIPVVTEPKKAAGSLNWAVQEMESRYKTFAEHGVRDIEGYNASVKGTGEELPQIVIIIDELSDLMMVSPNDVEDAICRLSQMARAAGIHLVIATQRPSVDVITGVIKANITSRIAFSVTSQVDSRTILDMGGAEKLLGRGDMLYYPVGEPKPIRIQGTFISDKEVESVVNFVKSQADVDYSEDIMEQINTENQVNNSEPQEYDELLPQAIEMVVESRQASISMLQRRLKIGYARAARLIDQMEERSIVGTFEGSKPRQVLVTKEQFYRDEIEM